MYRTSAINLVKMTGVQVSNKPEMWSRLSKYMQSLLTKVGCVSTVSKKGW